jgi:hypothetical protein
MILRRTVPVIDSLHQHYFRQHHLTTVTYIQNTQHYDSVFYSHLHANECHHTDTCFITFYFVVDSWDHTQVLLNIKPAYQPLHSTTAAINLKMKK